MDLVPVRFQFLGIPPKGEQTPGWGSGRPTTCFQFLGIPPKGELDNRPVPTLLPKPVRFPISRDPPEGGTCEYIRDITLILAKFPISRDPPEGGTGLKLGSYWWV